MEIAALAVLAALPLAYGALTLTLFILYRFNGGKYDLWTWAKK